MSILSNPIRAFFAAAALSAVLCGLVYASVQQTLRQSANDPQIQLAEDIAAALGRGAQPSDVVPPGTIDAKTSLAAFGMVFDATGKVQAANVQIDGQPPQPPAGVFDWVRAHGEDRVTWQTKGGQRFAAVVTPYKTSTGSGFVLVARSLREVEIREAKMGNFAAAAWLACLAVAALAALALRPRKA